MAELLDGVIRPYAWGSRSVLAELQGRPVPSAGPEAELWLGAHPGDPSTVRGPQGPVSLAELIAQDPRRVLGPTVTAAFGARLPYLMKVLAAAAPLSLQAHPDAEHARAAYAAERAAGVTGGNYVDEFHKPELLVAVTPFEALCGFRAPDVSAAVFEAFDLPELAPVVASLRSGVAGLRDAVRTLLTWPEQHRPALVEAVVAAAGKADPGAVGPGAVGPGAVDPGDPYAAGCDLVTRLAEFYPGDPGVLVALLLNQVRLQPGEAIWMPAGNLHAYLFGAGVEIMAASDNVLRGGLTPKRVDVDELLRVLRFEVLDDPVVRPRPVAAGVVTWSTPVREFALYRVTLDAGATAAGVTLDAGATDAGVNRVTLAAGGPRVVLCRTGSVAVDDGAATVRLPAGQAAFAAAAGGPLVLSGSGEAYVATVGAGLATNREVSVLA